MTRYAVNEKEGRGLVVYDKDTRDAVCVCGPIEDFDGLAFPDEQAQRSYAEIICRLLNERAQP